MVTRCRVRKFLHVLVLNHATEFVALVSEIEDMFAAVAKKCG